MSNYVSYSFAVVREGDYYVFTFDLPDGSPLTNPVTMEAAIIQYEADFFNPAIIYVFDVVSRYIAISYGLCTSFVSTSAFDFIAKLKNLPDAA